MIFHKILIYEKLYFISINKFQMKKVISTLALLGLGLAGGLRVGLAPRADTTGNAYDLSCDGASGSVKYFVDGLPNGVVFNGATIVIGDYAAIGTHNVRVLSLIHIY